MNILQTRLIIQTGNFDLLFEAHTHMINHCLVQFVHV